jgi:hypothetical protein
MAALWDAWLKLAEARVVLDLELRQPLKPGSGLPRSLS